MEYDSTPACLNTSQCREIFISAQVPLTLALYMYGYVMPIIVAVTVATNSFIVLVLSHRYLRTPTNFVLLAMAVTELLTGLSCLPWLLYYYTFKGYQTDEEYGLPAFWCTMFPHMASILPSIFHTAAIWLTVYLAVQRYIYICIPKKVRSYCTIRRSKHTIATICVIAVWIYAPELFVTYNQSYTPANGKRRICLRVRSSFIQLVGSNIYYYIIYGLHTLLSHTVPCILLVIFTWKLIAAIREADRRHAGLLANSKRRSTLANDIESAKTSVSNGGGEYSASPSAGGVVAVKTFKRATRLRSSINESRRIQSLKQNTRMLLVVILLFLVTEIPAAMIFSLHVSTVALQITAIQRHYPVLNKLLIIRNVLIVMSYPFRFAIYCGMSQQFREVVRSMLTERVFWPCDKRAQHFGRPKSAARPTNDTTQCSDDRRNHSDVQHFESWKQGSNAELDRSRQSLLRDTLLDSTAVLQSPATLNCVHSGT